MGDRWVKQRCLLLLIKSRWTCITRFTFRVQNKEPCVGHWFSLPQTTCPIRSDQTRSACSTSRNTGTRNTGTSRNIPEHPKNPEHPKKPGTLPRKPGTPQENPEHPQENLEHPEKKPPEISKSRCTANMLPRA